MAKINTKVKISHLFGSTLSLLFKNLVTQYKAAKRYIKNNNIRM